MIRATATRAPLPQDLNYAVAKIGFIPRGAAAAAALQQNATALGFRATGTPNEYQHSDGSWIRLEANGVVNRGVSNVQFQGIPKGGPTVTVTTNPTPAQRQNIAPAPIDTSRPPIPPSMKNYGLARVGIVTTATVAAKCAAAGFVQHGTTWIHPDGSWIRQVGSQLQVGWNGYALKELPYKRGWL